MAIGPPPSRFRPLSRPFRVIFMGSPPLAARILARLLEERGLALVVAVVTRPDRPRGRGLDVTPSEVARLAVERGIPTLKPIKIATPEFVAELKGLRPDLLIVAAYGKILPKAVLEAPRLLPINVHASILPRHRGAAPVEAAILAGDRVTGITIMRMTERMDAGPILLQREIAVAPGETQGSLKEKLAELSVAALLEALEKLLAGDLQETVQDEKLATYTRPVRKQDAIIDWKLSAEIIERMTRAYDPWPVARTTLEGSELLIHRAAVDLHDGGGFAPGTIVAVKPVPIVQCGLGRLALLELQAPGKKRMGAAEFARGRRLKEGLRLGV